MSWNKLQVEEIMIIYLDKFLEYLETNEFLKNRIVEKMENYSESFERNLHKCIKEECGLTLDTLEDILEYPVEVVATTTRIIILESLDNVSTPTKKKFGILPSTRDILRWEEGDIEEWKDFKDVYKNLFEIIELNRPALELYNSNRS